MKLKKALDYAISTLTKEIEILEDALETKDCSFGQRDNLEKKLHDMKSDLKEFRSISI